MKKLLMTLMALTLVACASNPVKSDNVEIIVEKEEKKPPAPCSNFCRPIDPPVITPYQSKIIIPMSRDPRNEDAVSYVTGRLKEKVNLTSINVMSYTDLKMTKKEALTFTQNKANSIKSALVATGIKPELITAVGMGYEPDPQPCKKNDNACHISNRSTAIIIEGTTSSR